MKNKSIFLAGIFMFCMIISGGCGGHSHSSLQNEEEDLIEYSLNTSKWQIVSGDYKFEYNEAIRHIVYSDDTAGGKFVISSDVNPDGTYEIKLVGEGVTSEDNGETEVLGVYTYVHVNFKIDKADKDDAEFVSKVKGMIEMTTMNDASFPTIIGRKDFTLEKTNHYSYVMGSTKENKAKATYHLVDENTLHYLLQFERTEKINKNLEIVLTRLAE